MTSPYRIERERGTKEARQQLAVLRETPFEEKDREATRKQYIKNGDKIRSRRAAWRAENKEKIAAYERQWYAKNRDKILSKQAAWRAANKNKRSPTA